MESKSTVKLVSIDPGGNTGIVRTQIELDKKLAAHEIILAGVTKVHDVDCRDVYAGYSGIRWIVDRHMPDIVLMESFRLWTQHADLTPVQLLTLAHWDWSDAPWTLMTQEPHERSVVRDDQLKRWDLWHPGRKDVNAAMKHLVVLVRKIQNGQYGYPHQPSGPSNG